MPRLFTGLEIPHEIAMPLSLLQSGLEGVRWIEQSDFHITLRFIGDVDRPMANEIAQSLGQISHKPFELQLDQLDVFGGKKPRSLFAKVRHNELLERLQLAQERVMQQIGLQPEGRKFVPHVTLARFGNIKSDVLAQWLSHHGGFFSQAFTVPRFVLYSARESIGGGPYVIEQAYPLTE